MSLTVTLIDYGIGNVYSVQRALETSGATVLLTDDASRIEASTHVVLPGVGAFADGMAGLRERGLVEPLLRYAASDRPLLGICLGMQMLATVSEEFGQHSGLGLVPGRVLALCDQDIDGAPLKIPHTGWTALHKPEGSDWRATPLRGTTDGESVYLVHSFHVSPAETRDRLADCTYGGQRVCAAIRRNRVFGFQFHPEKSGPVGLRMLREFLAC